MYRIAMGYSLPTRRSPLDVSSLERDAATGLPLKAMAEMYVANLKIASAAAKGEMGLPEVGETPATNIA